MEKISLKQNRFVIFSIFYSQIIIIGTIIMVYAGKFIPELISQIISVGIFAFAIYRVVSAMAGNDRTLVSAGSTLMLEEKVKKQDKLLFKIEDEEVEKVEQIEKDLFKITKKDGNFELLPLTYSLNAARDLDLQVRVLLCKKYGEKAEAISNEDVVEYLNTNVIPKEIEKASKGTRANNMAYSILGLIFSAIPTCLVVLSAIILVLKALIFVLGLLH